MAFQMKEFFPLEEFCRARQERSKTSRSIVDIRGLLDILDSLVRRGIPGIPELSIGVAFNLESEEAELKFFLDPNLFDKNVFRPLLNPRDSKNYVNFVLGKYFDASHYDKLCGNFFSNYHRPDLALIFVGKTVLMRARQDYFYSISGEPKQVDFSRYVTSIPYPHNPGQYRIINFGYPEENQVFRSLFEIPEMLNLKTLELCLLFGLNPSLEFSSGDPLSGFVNSNNELLPHFFSNGYQLIMLDFGDLYVSENDKLSKEFLEHSLFRSPSEDLLFIEDLEFEDPVKSEAVKDSLFGLFGVLDRLQIPGIPERTIFYGGDRYYFTPNMNKSLTSLGSYATIDEMKVYRKRFGVDYPFHLVEHQNGSELKFWKREKANDRFVLIKYPTGQGELYLVPEHDEQIRSEVLKFAGESIPSNSFIQSRNKSILPYDFFSIGDSVYRSYPAQVFEKYHFSEESFQNFEADSFFWDVCSVYADPDFSSFTVLFDSEENPIYFGPGKYYPSKLPEVVKFRISQYSPPRIRPEVVEIFQSETLPEVSRKPEESSSDSEESTESLEFDFE